MKDIYVFTTKTVLDFLTFLSKFSLVELDTRFGNEDTTLLFSCQKWKLISEVISAWVEG
jgi:hypothetical protein